jgi:hypothetical protein
VATGTGRGREGVAASTGRGVTTGAATAGGTGGATARRVWLWRLVKGTGGVSLAVSRESGSLVV